MDKNAVLKIIDRFHEALGKAGVEALKIVLYGSYAKGDWNEWSDIDLVVVSQDFAGKSYWERIDVLSEAICEVWEPIEAVAMTSEEWDKGDSMIAQFAREGEMVFSA